MSKSEDQMTDSQWDLVSAYGDGWYDGFLAAKSHAEDGADIECYSEDEIRELSEYAEDECQLAKAEKRDVNNNILQQKGSNE